MINKALERLKTSKNDQHQSLLNLIKHSYEFVKEWQTTLINSNKMIAVRRVIITPSRIEFKFPTVNMPNRVIRKYRDFESDFLRVSFLNDNHSTGSFNSHKNGKIVIVYF